MLIKKKMGKRKAILNKMPVKKEKKTSCQANLSGFSPDTS
jgi:hypothetical protein